MNKAARWVVLGLAVTLSGCGVAEEMKQVKKLNDAIKTEVGGDPNVHYSRGSEGKVVEVKFYAELKSPEEAAAKTKQLVDQHLQKVDKLQLWQCKKSAGGVEMCTGL